MNEHLLCQKLKKLLTQCQHPVSRLRLELLNRRAAPWHEILGFQGSIVKIHTHLHARLIM